MPKPKQQKVEEVKPKMAPTEMTVKPSITISTVPIKQSVLNLETGSEEKIEFKQQRFVLRDYDPKVDGDSKVVYLENALGKLQEMVQPPSEQIEALCAYLTSQSYQSGKKSALATGKYLTQEIRSRITTYMKGLAQFEKLSASEAFEKWSAGYAAQKPGALKILDAVTAQDTEDFSDLA